VAVEGLSLLFLRDFKSADHRLPLDRVANGALQMLAGEISFYQVILHALMDGFDGQRFVVLAGEHDQVEPSKVLEANPAAGHYRAPRCCPRR